MSPYIRTVRTASGATAVQVIYSRAGGTRDLTHIGSAHTDEEIAALKAQAQAMLHDENQLALDLDVEDPTKQQPARRITAITTGKRAGYLLDAIDTTYQRIGLDQATESDEVFRNLVRARIIKPGSKLDSIKNPRRSRSDIRQLRHH